MAAGIPGAISDLTVSFPYGDLAVTEDLFQMLDGQIACLILEATTQHDPPEEYLTGLLDLTHRYGSLLIFDEMIAGFRLSASGAQGLFGVTPDLSTFGKALGNGFAVSALAGRRDLMERGGIRHEHERVFLLSTTHGAETHALAAAIAVMRIHQEEDVPAQLRRLGQRLADGVAEVASAAGVGDHLITRGRPENLVFATLDEDLRPSQQYRTLFMRQLILGGVLGPSFVVSTALTDDDIDRTIDVVADACGIYCKALDAGDPTPWLDGRPIKPVFRTFA
jgi:glutamate-1-semialdehyde 2,1-aminomutase